MAGGCQLGEVVGERGHQRPQRTGSHSAIRVGELRRREVVLLGVFLEFGAHDLDATAETGTDGIEQLLAAHSPGVPKHQVGVVSGFSRY